MSGFSGINQFGSLTAQNGTKIDYKTLIEKYDENEDGKLSTTEFEKALKEEKLDSIELSSVNTNGDEEVDENELSLYEQKYEMQQAINDMAGDITKDFNGAKSQYLEGVTAELKEYITSFAEQYQKEHPDDISGMADAFKKDLPTKYAEIKKNALAKDPTTFKSDALDNVLSSLNSANSPALSGAQAEGISDTAQKKIGQFLEKEMNAYIKANPNCIQEELEAHLEAYLNQSDAELMTNAIADFNNSVTAFGSYIDADELAQLKDSVKEFLTKALEQKVTVQLGGKNIATTNAITSVLKSYTDGAKLLSDMQEAIANLSTVSRKEQIIKADKLEQAEVAEKNFTNIKGSAYQINAGLIDYSKIDERYFNDGEIYQRGKGWSGSKDKAYDEGYNILTSDNMKSQIKSQIETMLKEQGIEFDKIATVFENVYNQTAQEVLNSDGMITGRGARGLSSKGKAHINVKTMVDTFITTFNTNIAKAIDEMNASNKDMDTIDLDFTQAGKDENGNEIKVLGTDKSVGELYANNKKATKTEPFVGFIYLKQYQKQYQKQAEQIVNNMQVQMLNKAKAMCTANGVEFKEDIFNTMFNNAKSAAINAGVTSNISTATLNVKTLLDTFTDNFKQNYSAWVEEEAKKAK